MINDTNSFLQNLDPDNNFFNEVYFGKGENSLYYSVDSYNKTFQNSKNLKIFHLNIRSFRANFDLFNSTLATLCDFPDIVCLTETWFSSDSLDINFLDGFSSFHTVRPDNMRGGGVSIFIRDQLNAFKLPKLSICNDKIETCAIRVTLKNFD